MSLSVPQRGAPKIESHIEDAQIYTKRTREENCMCSHFVLIVKLSRSCCLLVGVPTQTTHSTPSTTMEDAADIEQPSLSSSSSSSSSNRSTSSENDNESSSSSSSNRSTSNENDNEHEKKKKKKGVKKWILPQGAEQIVRQIASEQILFELMGDIFSMAVVGLRTSKQRQALKNKAEFTVMRNVVQEFPATCQRRYEFRWEDGTTRNLYPLAALCCLSPPLDVVQAVYLANSGAAKVAETNRESLPLHYACGFGASVDVVQFLYNSHPDAICAGRTDMVTPLHIACAYFKGGEPDVINFLLDKYPQGSRQVATDMGWLPIHSAAHGGASLPVLKRLADLHPGSLEIIDSNGRTPLHVACERKGNLESIAYLLAKAPQLIDMEDGSRFTPITLAAMHQTVPVIELLLSHHEVLEDHHGVTLLHMAAFQNTADVIDFLAKRHPYMITARVRDADMYTPLLAACRHDASADVVRALIQHDRSTLNMADGDGRPPIESARDAGACTSVIQVLQEELNAVAASAFTNAWPLLFTMTTDAAAATSLPSSLSSSHTSSSPLPTITPSPNLQSISTLQADREEYHLSSESSDWLTPACSPSITEPVQMASCIPCRWFRFPYLCFRSRKS